MNTIITIVVVLSMIGLLFMMVNYARFIHSHKGEAQPPRKDTDHSQTPDSKDEDNKL